MGLVFKPGVDFSGLSQEIVEAVWQASTHFAAMNLDMIVTSGRDGKHKPTSYHYSGDAVDFRSKHVPRSKVVHLRDAIAKHVGPRYDVLLENLGGEQEHYHMEYNRRPQ